MKLWPLAFILVYLTTPSAWCNGGSDEGHEMTAVIRKALNDALSQPTFERQREIVSLLRTNENVLATMVEQSDSSRRAAFTALLRILKSLDAIAEHGPDSSDLPLANVEPPSETGLPAGVSPTAITNEFMRHQYERELQENRDKGEGYKQAIHTQRDAMRLVRECQSLIVKLCTSKQNWGKEIAGLIQTEDIRQPLADQLLGKRDTKNRP